MLNHYPDGEGNSLIHLKPAETTCIQFGFGQTSETIQLSVPVRLTTRAGNDIQRGVV